MQIETANIKHIDARLIKGDALHPNNCDLLALTGCLNVGLPVPDGWRVITGNQRSSLVAIIAMRYECEGWAE